MFHFPPGTALGTGQVDQHGCGDLLTIKEPRIKDFLHFRDMGFGGGKRQRARKCTNCRVRMKKNVLKVVPSPPPPLRKSQ